MTVTIYTTPTCPQCGATLRALADKGIAFQVRDVTTDHAAHQLVVDLGYRQAPVVVTEAGHWSGFRPDKISELAARLAVPAE